MFESQFWDRLTRTRPHVPAVVYGPVVAVLAPVGLASAGAVRGAIAIVAGYLVWTLTEYWIHRGLFHLTPKGALLTRIHWRAHGSHHEHPNDPDRLVMPLSVTVPLTLLALGAFRLALGGSYWTAFGAGFIAGYLVYDLLHCHLHRDRPKSRLGRWLRGRHLRHHFHDERTALGVSAPYWDVVFGTARSSRTRRR
jgi:sterol desaturase/sphingolipid hydroxylase (fatty acid hydroxylase superfamily)